ncbi:hypothetical protein WH43_10650 [Rheinheimera sp. KL1]|uniref:hypothetical protein n=1 Tax=Rheinheimera sp. KL1 TaxID=1635005 RepID=UPI0006A98CD6|nr:hypothetical protein [Rheinheimera sp. KL1]KOO58224.1 hypothetical protein WH43_10650 [Rheinheimera sp. KL1]
MMYQLDFDFSKLDLLKSLIKGHFDNPERGLKIFRDSIFISGWFLSEDYEVYLKVKYRTGQVFKKLLDVERPDVIKHFGLSERSAMCGFQLQIEPKGQEFILAVSVGSVDYDILNISSFSYSEDEISKVKSAWLALHVHDVSDIALDDEPGFEYNVIKPIFCFSSIQSVYAKHVDALKARFEHSSDFLSFFEGFYKRDWAVDYIENLASDSLGTGFECHCVASYVIDDFNFLLFDSVGFRFYIVQHCTNVLIVFPTLFECVSLYIEEWANAALDKLGKLFSLLVKLSNTGIKFPAIGPAKFHGLNVSQSRPYHYVYDYLHGIDYLSQKGVLNLNAYSVKGFDFLDVSIFFDNIAFSKSDDAYELNKYLSLNQFFVIMPCLQYVNGSYDRDLISLSAKLRAAHSHSLDLEPYDFVLWVGISVEKRKWVEQVEGISSILKMLKIRFSKLCVILDGRTSTITDSFRSNKVVLEENLIFNEIISLVPDVNFVNLIGKGMQEKLAFAEKVDFFLTSFATDSLYVSCINKKRGVVYVAPSINVDQRKLHVHHTIVEVPGDKITEIKVDGKSWHETSVSMDWRDVYACIEQVLDRGN